MGCAFGLKAIGIGVDQTLVPVSTKIGAVLLHALAEKFPNVSTRRPRTLLRQPDLGQPHILFYCANDAFCRTMRAF